MKAAVVHAVGHSPTYTDFVEPEAGRGEVAITVTASALSPLARARASGSHYSATQAYPFVAGVDGVGRLGDGRRAYFILPRAPFRAMAQRSVIAEGQFILIPDDLDDATAAVIANPGMSSWAALVYRAHLKAGETVLINGATGAAGRLAVRIARHLGAARVVATGRNQEVLEAVGADDAILIGDDSERMEQAILAAFAARIDIVLDFLWGPSARSILVGAAKAAPDGVPVRFVQIGSASGTEIAMPAAVLRSSSIEMVGSGLGSVGLDQLIASVAGVLAAATSANLTLDYRSVPLAEVEDVWGERGERILFMV